MTPRDRVGDPPREAAGDVGHRQGFPTPSGGSPAQSLWVVINAPWYKHGGGTPGLWETDGQMFQENWHMENVIFFMETMTPATIEDALSRAAKRLEGVLDSPVPARMLAEFKAQRPLLEHRLQVLPYILVKKGTFYFIRQFTFIYQSLIEL